MRVYEINKQTIEIYGYEEDEFEKFLEKFNFDFKARPYRPLTWFEKLLRVRYKHGKDRKVITNAK